MEIIGPDVWLCYRFPLSLREVREMMPRRGIVISREIIRRWCAESERTRAGGLRRRRARPGDAWHGDEVFLTINGARRYLWRAVGQDGNVLGILVTSRRGTRAAARFFRRPLTCPEHVPGVVITGKLGSYPAARR